jgi:hypothetical protein
MPYRDRQRRCQHCQKLRHLRADYAERGIRICNKCFVAGVPVEATKKYRVVRRRTSNTDGENIATIINDLGLLSSSKRGAFSELIAAADLLARGFEVFRSVSDHASCDLIALANGRSVRVEVRTGRMLPSGYVSYPMKPQDVDRSDIFAVVVGVKVHYFQGLIRSDMRPVDPLVNCVAELMG